MAWSSLNCWIIHKIEIRSLTFETLYTPLVLWEIWDLCNTKAEHIWIFYGQSWNMKPITIGIQQWLHMGMVFLLKDQEQQVRLPCSLTAHLNLWNLLHKTCQNCVFFSWRTSDSICLLLLGEALGKTAFYNLKQKTICTSAYIQWTLGFYS